MVIFQKEQKMSLAEFLSEGSNKEKKRLNLNVCTTSYSIAALPYMDPKILIGGYVLVIGLGVGLISLSLLERKLAAVNLPHIAEMVKFAISVILPLAAIGGGIWAVLHFPVPYGFF
jgi:hypothetical protein